MLFMPKQLIGCATSKPKYYMKIFLIFMEKESSPKRFIKIN